jgi:tetratricopeptide (TPR) repeat protein
MDERMAGVRSGAEEVRARIDVWLARGRRPLSLLARIARVDYLTLWRFRTGQTDVLPPEVGLRLLPHLVARRDEDEYRHVAAWLALTAVLRLADGQVPIEPASWEGPGDLALARAIARTALSGVTQRRLAVESGVGESQLSRWLRIPAYRLRSQEMARVAAAVAPRLPPPARQVFVSALGLDRLVLLVASQAWPVLPEVASVRLGGSELLRVASLVVAEAVRDGRWRDAATFTDWSARQLAERDDPELAHATLLAAERALDVGDFVSWRRWNAMALLAAERGGDPSLEGRARHFTGWASYKAGDLAAAQTEFDRCLALAQDDPDFLDDHHWLGNVHLAGAQTSLERSAEHLAAAERHLARARAFHERAGAEFNAAYDLLGLAQVERLRGRHDVSRRLRRRAAGVFGADAARLQVELQDREGEVLAGAGPAGVMRWARDALAELSALGFAEAVGGVLRLLSVAHWTAGADDASRRRARELIAAATLHYPVPPWELADLPDGLAQAAADRALRRQVVEMIGAGERVFRNLAPLAAPGPQSTA